jgi:two-component system CheB/CheR fusion protein
VNEELVTVNSELQSKIDQLSQAENDMRNLLESINMGTIFLDTRLIIKGFTAEASKVINLIPSDVGRPISHIVSNLQDVNLSADAENVLDTLMLREKEVQAKNKNWYLMRSIPYRTAENVIDGVTITFTDVTRLRKAEEELRKVEAVRAALNYAEGIIETVREPFVILDVDLRVKSANRSFYRTFQVSKEETERRLVYEIGNRQWDIPALKKLLNEILLQNTFFEDFEVDFDFPNIGWKKMLLNARRIVREEIGTQLILLGIEDVSSRTGVLDKKNKILDG